MIRACCEPGRDNILIFPPTYGMYEVAANINNVEVKAVLMTEDFQLNVDASLKAIDKNTKLIFICSPNNPSGNMMKEKDVEALLDGFNGLVVLDEAYIDFAENKILADKSFSISKSRNPSDIFKSMGHGSIAYWNGICLSRNN